MGSSGCVSVNAGCFEVQGLAPGPWCPWKVLQTLDGIPQLGLRTLHFSQAALLGRQRQWVQSQGRVSSPQTSLPHRADLPQGSGRGSHQTFHLVGLTAWRVVLWIQIRGPVGIRGKGEAQRFGNTLPAPDWRDRDPEAGSARLGGGA